MRARILEQMGRLGDAMTAYQENLSTNAPDEKQREAILKIATLAAALTNYPVAVASLDNYLQKFPDSAQADVAMLTGGELLLKDQVFQGATNRLGAAQAKFDQMLAKYRDSLLAGKALLDRGWCEWLAGKAPESLADFQAAATRDLSPLDYAVAKFKAGDVLYAQQDYAGARNSYRAVFPGAQAGDLTGRSPEERDLGGRALYQELRASLELNDMTAAGAAFDKIFQMFSDGDLGMGSALLYGESMVKPDEARGLFLRVAEKFSGKPLEPELKLAIARTYEQQSDWLAAAMNYVAWLHDFPTNSLRPQAEYALAQATYQAGDEAGALQRFTKFVGQYPANPLAPRAQWWVAEHYFRAGEFIGAETNFEAVFQNTNAAWKNSGLVCQAQFMAGNAAMGRAGYKDAPPYFKLVYGDTTCTDEILKVQARFASGTAYMLTPGDTNATLANLIQATNLFSQIAQLYPTNEFGMRAWGELANCDWQLGDYAGATNAYAQVYSTNSPADVAVRSGAQVGCGLVLEKMAALADGDARTNLQNQALENYLAVFNTWTGDNLREGEKADAFWVQAAGMHAAPLVGQFNGPRAQKIFLESLKTNLPPLSEAIDRKIQALPAEKN
jgi:tetratricopeptide (TPR) repeat protein